MIHLKVEREISQLHKAGLNDVSVLNALLPSGQPHEFEGFQFDYKSFCIQEDRKSTEDHADDLIRDAAAFYNSMGGYLVLCFSPGVQQELFANISDNDRFNQTLSGYLGANIGVRISFFNIDIRNENATVLLVYIPKRAINIKPKSFRKNSRNLGTPEKQRFTIRKDDIYCRYEHECKCANSDIELLTFLFSDREPETNALLATKIENNLPPKDPNLIAFVGRKEYLECLWQWISEPRRPIKVLTAAGGLGKTTVAYEFATQVLDRPGSGFEAIVWLSGKKLTFSPLLGKMVSTTRCDFENVDQLLDNVLLQVGSPPSVIQATPDREDKISLCIDAFSTLSVLLIIDDVDSLPRDEQNDLYSIIYQIIVSANVQNDNSRVLFTSRLELLTGREQRIAMHGFEGNDFDDYLRVNVSYMISDERISRKIMSSKNAIFDASAGSPIFVTSIIRLVSLGHDLSQAVAEWRGTNGEQIRAFAFEREIDQLSQSQREILYAMQLLSRARVDEIKDICGLTSIEIETDLSALKDYHLYATKGDPLAGTVLEVPEPIRLMHDVTRGKISDDRRRIIERQCLSAKSGNDDPARYIALVISQTVTHWKAGHHEVAETYLTQEIQKNAKIGEFYCLRARTRLNIKNSKTDQIESDFEQAEKYGCSPFDLLKFWYIHKIKSQDWRGLYRLHNRKKSISESFPVFNCCYVMATKKIGDKALVRKPTDAMIYYKEVLSASSTYIGNGKSMGYFHQMRALMNEAAISYIDALKREHDHNGIGLIVFRFVVSCLDYNLAQTYLVKIGLRHIENWVKGEASASEITRNRSTILDDIQKLVKYLNAQTMVRTTLVAECERVQELI